jgi:hypothetical protein
MPIIEISLLVMAALAALGAVTLVTVGILTIGFLIDWFRDRAAQVTDNPGKVAYVQGIFDKEKSTFTEARRIKADDVDSDVQRAHVRHKVAIWE